MNARSLTIAVVGLLALAGFTSADSVKIGGAWIPDVVISDIYDGRLLWTNSLGTAFAQIAPATSARFAQRMGADKIAGQIASGQADKR